jgi:protein TonB
MMLARIHLEHPTQRVVRWSGSAGMIVAVHVAAAAAAFLFWPSEPPTEDERPGAIMMELESLAAESPSDQQDIAEQPLFDKSAPPPSPTETPEPIPPQETAAEPEPIKEAEPEKVAEAPAPVEPAPEVKPEEASPVEEAPLAPEPEVTLPKEVKAETPPEEKPVERPEPKKTEPDKKPKEKAEKAKEPKAAQKSDSKQQKQAAASAKGKFDPNPVYRAKPAYPSGARASKIEGYVVVSYSVSASGSVTSVSVVSSSPPGVFNSATVAAVRQWRFKPSPGGASGRRTTVRFKLR